MPIINGSSFPCTVGNLRYSLALAPPASLVVSPFIAASLQPDRGGPLQERLVLAAAPSLALVRLLFVAALLRLHVGGPLVFYHHEPPGAHFQF